MSNTSPIYQHDIVEFVTVAVQYCAFLEDLDSHTRPQLLDTMSKILPLLYLKGTLLPHYQTFRDDLQTADYVTESDYETIRQSVSCIMAEHDDYLDVFIDDMKYSDQPILTTISENLADIYQDLRNFLYIYKLGAEPEILASLDNLNSIFPTDWGQKLVNVLRAIHEVKYNNDDIDD